MNITRVALKFRTSVYVLIVFLVVVGIDSYRSLPLEAAPDVQIPIVLVTTIYPGVAPADVESLVTNILERELKTLKDVKKMTSTSAESMSVVNIEFESGVDMDDAYQKVRDKVSQAKVDLPAEAEEPILTEINISEFPIMVVNLFGPIDLVALKRIAETIEERIEMIDGVLGVDITGGREREIHVRLDPERMSFYKLGVGNVIQRIQEEHRTTPGGNIELGNSKYLVRIPGEYEDVSLMEDIVLKAPGGHPIKLRDIGRVVDGFRERESISRVNGQECVTLRVQKRAGENIVRIADSVRELLVEFQPTFPAGVETLVRQDESKHVRSVVKDLENSVITGLLLVLIVLFMFMGFKNASFVAVAIPLSMLITMIALKVMGVTLNMVVLFSLIIALGMLVDNSIVIVENIYRHAADGATRERAAAEATQEVAWPVIASTATTVAAFAPMLFWPGIMGEFMGYLPLTVITALVASLFVALVLNPVIAASFLKATAKGSVVDESGEVRGWLMKGYKHSLTWSLRHPIFLLGLALVSLAGVIMLYANFGAGVEFFPQTTPERGQATVKAPQGTVIKRTDTFVRQVEAIAIGDSVTEDVIANVGFAGGGMFGGGGKGGGGGSSHQAVVDIEFKDRKEMPDSTRTAWDAVAAIRSHLGELSGAEYRIDVEKMGPPTGAAVAVEISGPDYDVLYGLARKAKDLIARVEGVVDIKDDYDPGKPEIRVEVDREQAMLRKVNTAKIAQAVRTAVNGTTAAVLREGDEEYDIVVRYDRPYRSSIRDLEDIRVLGKDDVLIPLGDVARVETSGGIGSVKHIDQKRTILVSADVQGRSSSEALGDVQALIGSELAMPSGYVLRYAGESEEQEKAAAFLGRAFGIGLLLMALILITQFNSVLRPTIIMASVVMSLIGVLLGLLITKGKFGIMMTGMGTISLAGVVVNNAIVLMDYINQLRERHGLDLTEAVVRAGIVRFRPVMMTAITTVLGMLPMALGISIDFATWSLDTGSSSTEWWGPMAQAIIFGLAFATLLTLILVPVMYHAQVRATAAVSRLFRRADGTPEGDKPAPVATGLLLALAASACLWGVPAPAVAQIAQGEAAGPTYSITDARRMALERNVNLKMLDENVRQAEILRQRAYTILLPNLSADGSITRTDKEIGMDMPNFEALLAGDLSAPGERLIIQEQWGRRWGVTANMALFNAQSIPLIKNAKTNIEATRLERDHQQAELLFAVSAGCYALLSSEQARIIAEEDIRNAKEFVKLAEARLKVGRGVRIEVLRATLEVQYAIQRRQNADDAVRLARAGLGYLIGAEGAFRIARPEAPQAVEASLAELQRRALSSRLDLHASRLRETILERDKTRVYSTWLPTFDVTWNYSWDSATGFGGEHGSWRLIFGARWEILKGGSRFADLRETASNMRLAAYGSAAKELVIREEVERAQVDLVACRRNITLARQQLSLSEETQALAKKQYQHGLTTGLQVIDANTTHRRAQQGLLLEQLSCDMAALSLDRALGIHP